jgi:large subunit ribosomal protein L30
VTVALKVTQKRSIIGVKPNQRETVRSLGLKRIHQTVVVEDNAVNRGYVHTVRHLVEVEEVDGVTNSDD